MSRIGNSQASCPTFCQPIHLAALKGLLTDEEIEVVCCQLGHQWRNRIFTPPVTVRSLVYRSLNPDKTIENVLADMVANDDALETEPTDSAWCQARSRLPQAVWPELIQHSANRLDRAVGNKHLYQGRPIYIADGSTLSMPDTPALVEAFGYANTKHGPSRFPVARITFIVRAGTEGVRAYRLGPYRSSENAQFHQMWHVIPRGAICISDRKFSSFYDLAKLAQRGVDMICRLHQSRDPSKLISQGRKIGKDQWIVPLELCAQLRKQYNDPSLPDRLWVRLIRVPLRNGGKRQGIWLVTTLLDARRYRRSRIVRLYRRRWGIETRIGSVKTTLEMSVLRSTTPVGVRHEVAATILGHNLAWIVIHQAAKDTDTPADRISFASAVREIVAFSGRLRIATGLERERIYDRMLGTIARHTNPDRPGRVEPRRVKRDPVRYPFLTIPREEARRKCLS